ncbi:PQQ-dependent sugar dehydrogenase [Sphingomonas daechungensis]|uniref:PQQ-dependent sugar dehydrogenase n=1 Tax=Sphingomonas daechungensis TaxID=1176646 RepID=UPI00378528A2
MNNRLLIAGLVAASLAGCSDPDFDDNTQIGPNPVLPKPTQFLIPPMNVAAGTGWSAGQKPTVANGLEIQPLATGLHHPRFVYVLPNGDILAVQSAPPGEPVKRPKDLIFGFVIGKADNLGGPSPKSEISLIRDANGDGKLELQTTLLDNLNAPFGVTWVDGTLYVANTDGVVAYPFAPGQTKVSGPGRMLTPLPAGVINHHWTKSLVASPDGSKLYATVGSNSNIVENGFDAELGRAAVWEIDRKTGLAREFATGLRNPNSPSFYPGTNTFYVVVNERDELGAHLVPDYLTSVRDGGFYGWPYSYYGRHLDPRVRPQNPAKVASAILPDYALGSHVAPLGLTFYTGDLLPQFKGGAFIGEHGSLDRRKFYGYKVVYVPFAGGKPSGKAVDVVTGFLDAKNKRTLGRPVGVAVDRFGALLIADDVGNAVWRVTPASWRPGAAGEKNASPSGEASR